VCVEAFSQVHPTLDNYWRAVILLGRNVASYKFAMDQSLLELAAAVAHPNCGVVGGCERRGVAPRADDPPP